MSAIAQFEHQFVRSAPRELSPGVLYVSVEYCTMLHLCACGCGRKVVTPLSPNDWSMIFNGKTITVSPSIGSWSLPCKSHYVIRKGKVLWASQWSDAQIKRGREADLTRKRGQVVQRRPEAQISPSPEEKMAAPDTLWQRIIGWLNIRS